MNRHIKYKHPDQISKSPKSTFADRERELDAFFNKQTNPSEGNEYAASSFGKPPADSVFAESEHPPSEDSMSSCSRDPPLGRVEVPMVPAFGDLDIPHEFAPLMMKCTKTIMEEMTKIKNHLLRKEEKEVNEEAKGLYPTVAKRISDIWSIAGKPPYEQHEIFKTCDLQLIMDLHKIINYAACSKSLKKKIPADSHALLRKHMDWIDDWLDEKSCVKKRKALFKKAQGGFLGMLIPILISAVEPHIPKLLGAPNSSYGYKPKIKTVKGFTFEDYPSDDMSDEANEISAEDEESEDDTSMEESEDDTSIEESDVEIESEYEDVEVDDEEEEEESEEMDDEEDDDEEDEDETEGGTAMDEREDESEYQEYSMGNRRCVKTNIPFHLMTEKQKEGVMSRLYCPNRQLKKRL